MAGAQFIAVFDSGIGGLSILAEVRKLLPEARVAYLADTAAFPYGDLPDDELIGRVEAIMAALTKVAPPDLAVIACNTASTLVLEPLRARFDFPFVGCVPPVKPAGAAQARDGKAIGLLATPATVERPYTDNLIRAFAGDSPVIRIGAPGLARLAEAALRGRPLPPDAIREELAAFFDGAGQCLVDRVVLGCTHYPFLLPELAAALPADVLWLDSGEAIARRVRQLLAAVPERQATALPDMADSAVFTQGAADNAELAPLLRQLGFRQYGVMAFPRGADKAEAPARFVVL